VIIDSYIRKKRGSLTHLLVPTLKPRMLPCQEREVCRGPRIYDNNPCTKPCNRWVVPMRRHLLRLLMTGIKNCEFERQSKR